MARSPSRPGRARVVLGAAALFAAIFGARFADGSPSSGLTILYMVPVVLVAVELGRTAGIVAGLVALALFTAWAPFSPVAIGPSAFVIRGIVFVLVGAVAGQLADRLHLAVASAQASARHFELAGDLLCSASFDGYLTHLNGSWEECLGWSREELMAQPFLDFVHPDDRARTIEESARTTTSDATASFTNRYRTKSGEYRWIEWSSKADPEQRTIHAAARDVTERRAAEEARREAEERFRRAFDDSATGMAVVGVAGEQLHVILDANESCCRIFGVGSSALVGSRAVMDFVDPAHAPAVARGVERLLRGEDAVQRCEFRAVRPDGERIWLHLTASLVRDVAGQPLYRLVQLLDITERKSTEDRLRYLADHDPLSGVYNRRRFEQELRRELDGSGHEMRRSVVLLIDVDNFKTINDTLGHATGDAVIARLGDTLRQRMRTTDVVARLGGDEFAVILRRIEVAEAVELSRSIQSLTSAALTPVLGAASEPVTISIGIAPIGGAAVSADELLGRADRALYEAKRAGKNRAVVDGEAELV